ncbi:GTP 3',8-cyclase MoaA [Prosthecochloris sp. N3]|uniref:GTP 3',8-cyclase n=1 Tax=Prosthecochloris ethylica TaxID=2743976 RepID=A0ABR9XUQ5_9CHLB|nr:MULTISPECIES: GTP 3',8-cyclase MoaA [Prosthecochloris]MBF0587355.1 GTP 3',8-cyclase MoaA [Prosthecochloris ethylica]MBF0637685.1 GTP 3',8-cyclase MoaA [Prosthecochloris ethylica]NUK48676.1 GTP 3',8-cyclase MoaA [Prosthecochloris ethylica]RNA67218.1 GTP 3',8-cyclase MoaA [Prosthecochloris sp. ZM_2]
MDQSGETTAAPAAETGRVENRDGTLADRYGRMVDYVRLAVTSACNLRCVYCMREEHSVHNPGSELLSRKEIQRLLGVLAGFGVEKVRFTGGEPLLRNDIADLVHDAASIPGIGTVSLTTNGVLLDRYLDSLLAAGLKAVNFSLDTFDRHRYREITRRNLFDRARDNLEMLLGYHEELKIKVNVLLMRGINTAEIRDFVELTRNRPVTVRFMELMPFDDHQIWRTGRFMGYDRILRELQQLYPELQPVRGTATEYYSFTMPGHRGMVAIIPAFTRNFCSRCTRLRITSAGRAISCLYSREGIELLPALRSGADSSEIRRLLYEAVDSKPRDGRHAGGSAVGTSMSEIGG